MMALESSNASLLLVEQLKRQGITNTAVLNAIALTPRQLFVEEAFAHSAWENNALPIGQSQTISQPYIVAKMTELLLENNPRLVLEIGTGSGYQTAVLAQLVDKVCSVERIKALQYKANRRLKLLDLHNVVTKHGDGWQGWKAKGPYDAIIVTAAASSLPQALLEQLNDGGRLVIPVGENEQVLRIVSRKGNEFISRDIEPVRFVPLVNGELG